MLTKTDFLLFLDAPLHLWAKHHNRIEKPDPPPFQLRLMAQGQAVEAMAHDFVLAQIGDGVAERQPRLIDGPFEARPDYLVRDRAGVSDLYEVKSSSSGTREHEFDLAFQALVADAGGTLREVHLVLVDREYVRFGELEPIRFFKIERYSDKVNKRKPEVAQLRQLALAAVQADGPAGLAGCNDPQGCPCPSLCHPELPRWPIYDIPRLGAKAGQLKALGITSITDVPPDFPLSDAQRAHVDLVRSGRPAIDSAGLRAWLASLRYPLYFLDFETVNPALPLYDGYHPYDQVVFQFSVHVVDASGAEPQHHALLVLDADDPAPRIAASLTQAIGPEGSVLVWNKSFEERCNRTLARLVPQFAGRLDELNARLVDLMEVFSKGIYRHPEFRGSSSLKKVLPVLAPEMGYDDMAISGGEAAMQAWWEIVFGGLQDGERAAKEVALRAYSAQDTLALATVLNVLEREAGGHRA